MEILIIMLVIAFIVAAFFLIKKGVELCNKNDAWGLLLLFIPLNILGIFIGVIIMYNWRQKHYFDKK